jgi:hypothetical protein
MLYVTAIAADRASRGRACRWNYECICAATVLLFAGCNAVAPSNFRNWSPDQSVLPHAEFRGDQVTIRNVRNCHYLTADTYTVEHYDKTLTLADLARVDFIMVPFRGLPSLAHTMLSFGFRDGYHLAVSVEIRKEQGEKFAAWKGSLRQYEIMYVLGDERDLVKLRTNHRQDDVYLYQARTTPEKARRLLVDVLTRVNQLAARPEFYDTLTNNCTTNIVQHINRLAPNRVPYDLRVLLPGYSDRLAYDLGLIESVGSFEETRAQARINRLAFEAADSPDFSARIRR